MSSSEDFFPFDGSCECSKDADFTLTFDDKSCLKISKYLLEMASRVLRTAIRDCKHDGTLHLSKTSTCAWIFILNYIHPAGRSASCVESIITSSWDPLAEVLRQCDKYAFVSLKEDIDERQAKALNEKRARDIVALQPALDVVSSARQGSYILVDTEMTVFKTAREFDLPKTEKAIIQYTINVGNALEGRFKRRIAIGSKADYREYKIAESRMLRVMSEMFSAVATKCGTGVGGNA